MKKPPHIISPARNIGISGISPASERWLLLILVEDPITYIYLKTDQAKDLFKLEDYLVR